MIPKKRGRPATGQGEPVMVRLQPKTLSKLDAWIRKQADAPTRPEAIRRLLEQAFTERATSERPRAASRPSAPKVKSKCGKNLELLTRPSTITDLKGRL